MRGTRLLRSIYHTVAYNAAHRHVLAQASTMSFNGLQLVVEPAVHHPGIFKSGKIFARALGGVDLRGKAVLDMGTGSGILALTAALQGAEVVAVDKDPAAVRCAAENSRRNGLETSVRVIQGDLFAALPDRKFQVILFNPPYLLNETGSFRDMALYGGKSLDLVCRFAESARLHLTENGYILMIVSTDSDVPSFLRIFRNLNMDSILLETARAMFETFYVYKFVPRQTR